MKFFLIYRLALKVNTAPIIPELGELKRSVAGSYWTDCTCFHFIRRLRKIAKSDCKHHQVFLSVCLSVCLCACSNSFPIGQIVLNFDIWLFCRKSSQKITGLLTLILLTWRIWWANTNASKWQMWFNSAFKGLKSDKFTTCPMELAITPPSR